MQRSNAPFEIHLHGEVLLRTSVQFEQIQEALKPIWKYAGARSLADGARSSYEEEPGIKFDAPQRLLQFCWTVAGDVDFRQALDEMCMSLNELSETGATIEVTLVSEGELFVAVDGTKGPELRPGQQVRIRCAPHRTLILRNPDVDPFDILRAKLRWGAR